MNNTSRKTVNPNGYNVNKKQLIVILPIIAVIVSFYLFYFMPRMTNVLTWFGGMHPDLARFTAGFICCLMILIFTTIPMLFFFRRTTRQTFFLVVACIAAIVTAFMVLYPEVFFYYLL